jgi:hypothetical protein
MTTDLLPEGYAYSTSSPQPMHRLSIHITRMINHKELVLRRAIVQPIDIAFILTTRQQLTRELPEAVIRNLGLMKHSLLPLILDQGRIRRHAANSLNRSVASVWRAVFFEHDWLSVGAADGVVLDDPFIALGVD